MLGPRNAVGYEFLAHRPARPSCEFHDLVLSHEITIRPANAGKPTRSARTVAISTQKKKKKVEYLTRKWNLIMWID